MFLLTNNLNPVYFLMYTETPFCSCVLYYTFMFINGISKSLLQINCSSTSSTFQSLFILLTIHEAPAPQDSIKKSSNVASDCNRCPSDAMVLWHSANFEAATASSFSCFSSKPLIWLGAGSVSWWCSSSCFSFEISSCSSLHFELCFADKAR